MARRLGDPKSMAYALVSELSVSTYCAPVSIEVFQARRREAETALANVDDAYLRNFYSAILAYDEVNRGRITEARAAVQRLMVNRRLDERPEIRRLRHRHEGSDRHPQRQL